MIERKRERLPVSVSAAVLIEDEEERLLFLKQAAPEKGGKWGPPAGGVYALESPAEAAIRETEEETGLKVELVDIVRFYSVSRGPNDSGLGVVFRAKVVGGKLEPKEGEIEGARYFTPQELLSMYDDGQIYKPEYSFLALQDHWAGRSYPLEMIKKVR